MKKNAKIVGILIPAVLLIWGLIGYKVWKTMGGEEEPGYQKLAISNKSLVKKDTSTYLLILDFEDPFLRESPAKLKRSPASKSPKKPKVIKTVHKLPVRWPELRYHGLIENGKEHLCMLVIDKQSVFLARGNSHNQVKVVRVYADSVELTCGDEKRVIKKSGE